MPSRTSAAGWRDSRMRSADALGSTVIVVVAAVPAEQRVDDVLDVAAHRGQQLAPLEVAEVDEDLAHPPARLRRR